MLPQLLTMSAWRGRLPALRVWRHGRSNGSSRSLWSGSHGVWQCAPGRVPTHTPRSHPRFAAPPRVLRARYSVYVLYWYKSTNTDAAQAAPSSRRTTARPSRQVVYYRFTCFPSTNVQILTPPARSCVAGTFSATFVRDAGEADGLGGESEGGGKGRMESGGRGGAVGPGR
jgi:hypothetical protein